MDGYRLESKPFAVNVYSCVSLFRGISLARRDLPVVVKRHDFHFIQKPESQQLICKSLNTALAQAKVHHPNVCELLEVQLEIHESNCTVFHILESLERSVNQDIEERKQYTEPELRKFLCQTSGALAFAHSKGVAHRDVKPQNIFRTKDTYKVGDFDCYFLKRDSSVTKSFTGDRRYMSPQVREAYIYGSQYNAFKADVFALGASLLQLMTLNSPETVVTSDSLDEAVSREVERLPWSAQLKQLVGKMLAREEGRRPTLQEVYFEAASHAPYYALPEARGSPQLSSIPASRQFAAVLCGTVELYDVATQQSTHSSLSVDFGGGGSYLELENALLCIGAQPATTAVFSLDFGSLHLRALPTMCTPRDGPGLAKAGDWVYVFGGWDNHYDLNLCEKFSLEDKQWRPLGSMHQPRSHFTPCSFRRLIYLLCTISKDHRAMESFDSQTEVFALLPLALPLQLELGCWSVAFVADGELYLLTGYKQMARWKIDSEREFRLFSTNRECGSTQSPRILDSRVLIANDYYGQVEKFSLESFDFF